MLTAPFTSSTAESWENNSSLMEQNAKPDVRQIVRYAAKVGCCAGGVAGAAIGLFLIVIFLMPETDWKGTFILDFIPVALGIAILSGVLVGAVLGILNGLLIAWMMRRFFGALSGSGENHQAAKYHQAAKHHRTVGAACTVCSLLVALSIFGIMFHFDGGTFGDFLTVIPVLTVAAWWASQKVCDWYTNAGEEPEKQTKYDVGWFRLPLEQNSKAAQPTILAVAGFLCLAAAAVCYNPSVAFQNWVSIGLLITGLVLMPLGFLGGLAHRQYRSMEFAIILPLIGPLWCWLLFSLSLDQNETPILLLCLLLPFAVALLALRQSPWWKRVPLRTRGLAAAGMLFVFAAPILSTRQEVASAPHLSDVFLDSVYAKNDPVAIKWLNNRKIVVRGNVTLPSDPSFFGDDGPCDGVAAMEAGGGSCIEFDDIGSFDLVDRSQKVSILGTCRGIDQYGKVHLTGCRTVER